MPSNKPSPAPSASDAQTAAYFDQLTPEYSVSRLEYAANFIRQNAHEDASLIDLGCGVGNTLLYLKSETAVDRFTALDVSANCLQKTQRRLSCETLHGSVLDEQIAAQLEDRYDFAVLAAVLHHLVGKTRHESRQNAIAAIRNALRIVHATGYVIVHEPTFAARSAMDTVFHVKRILAGLGRNRRIPLLGYWGNLGAPVVSYYSPSELESMTDQAGGSLVSSKIEVHPERGLLGLALGALHRSDTTFIVQNGHSPTDA